MNSLSLSEQSLDLNFPSRENRRHNYGHYGQCPYKFQDPTKLVRNASTY